MPIYEYLCTSCGHELEVLQAVSEKPLKTCPSCKRRTMKKMVSRAGFTLKGTGWYVTDFRNKGKEKAPKPKEGEEAKSEKPEQKGAGRTTAKAH